MLSPVSRTNRSRIKERKADLIRSGQRVSRWIPTFTKYIDFVKVNGIVPSKNIAKVRQHLAQKLIDTISVRLLKHSFAWTHPEINKVTSTGAKMQLPQFLPFVSTNPAAIGAHSKPQRSKKEEFQKR